MAESPRATVFGRTDFPLGKLSCAVIIVKNKHLELRLRAGRRGPEIAAASQTNLVAYLRASVLR
jgi:hypothetical protein